MLRPAPRHRPAPPERPTQGSGRTPALRVKAPAPGRRAQAALAAALLGTLGCTSKANPKTAPQEARSKMTAPTIQLPGSPPFSATLSAQLRQAMPDAGPRLNRLALELSPYLRQHATNPVDWRPWGPAALAEARALGRPIFLSVGYSTCHWCHVMERESFEDVEIAAYLNAHFIPIKVDREQRPDVDAVYMHAVQLMTGSGGWPMTVVARPDGAPFFGGTYFPARDGDRGRATGLLTVLRRLREAFDDEPDRVARVSSGLLQAMSAQRRPAPDDRALSDRSLVGAAQHLAYTYDARNGGFGRAPKFPRPSVHELLLRYGRRAQDPVATRMVTHSLDQMMRGGIYDHIGGGFARYATDARWRVPHFEKMLYDNAQLLSLALHAYQAGQAPRFARLAADIADYALRDLQSPDGGFFSATDADSEGEEGKFFVWTPAQLRAALPPADAELVIRLFSVTEAGDFEGKSVLHLQGDEAAQAARVGLTVEALRDRWAALRPKLRAARDARVRPFLDDKLLVAWNGQLIGALAEASRVLRRRDYLTAAERAAERLWTQARRADGRLSRLLKGDKAVSDGVLEDYAFLQAGLLELFEATGQLRWLDRALALQTQLDQRFADPAGGYFHTADHAAPLLVRDKPRHDGAQPSGNAVAALTALRLAALTGQAPLKTRATQTLRALSEELKDGAPGAPRLAAALDALLDTPKEVLIVTTDKDDGGPLLAALASSYLPNRALVIAPEAALAGLQEQIPWLKGKSALGGRATAFVCRGQVCKKPTQDPGTLRVQLAELTDPIQAPPLPAPAAARLAPGPHIRSNTGSVSLGKTLPCPPIGHLHLNTAPALAVPDRLCRSLAALCVTGGQANRWASKLF